MRETSTDANVSAAIEDAKVASKAAGLIYVTDKDAGITRARRGKHFQYFNPRGKRIASSRELQRIASLAIPPAYDRVWICTHARGHIQATGRDARGRKQYRYHANWREARDETKFDRMIEFGTARPQLRKQLKRDLALRGLPRDKVLALIVSLLNRTCIRVGNAEYAKNNGSFGLTTLRDRHVKFLREGRAIFDFRGKGGLKHEVRVDDRQLTEIVHRCQDLPGQMLFQFVDDAGQQHGVDSTLVNEYLRRVMDGEFTAKDFRTWHATLRALALLSAQPLPDGATVRAIKQTIVETVREVASELRNTPAVCRKAYINPLVFMAWQDGSLHRILGKKRIRGPLQQERATLSFLKQAGRN